jgi:hypothetical protein
MMTIRDVALWGRTYRWRGDSELTLVKLSDQDYDTAAHPEPWTPSPCVQWNFDQQARALAARNIHAVPPRLGMVTR